MFPNCAHHAPSNRHFRVPLAHLLDSIPRRISRLGDPSQECDSLLDLLPHFAWLSDGRNWQLAAIFKVIAVRGAAKRLMNPTIASFGSRSAAEELRRRPYSEGNPTALEGKSTALGGKKSRLSC